MAELPDLTVFAGILNRKFKGKRLHEIEITEARKLNVPKETLRNALEGHELTGVTREGKTLQLHFSGEQVLGLHLMLRGELVGLKDDEKPKFQIVAFRFDNGEGFAVVDMQKQATPTLQPIPVEVPDALNVDQSYFVSLLSKKRTNIKTLLMDQKSLRGIGNSYADEILYHAGVSPFSIANALPAQQAAKILESLNTVLHRAIKDIKQANGDELTGELKDFMSVHDPRLKKTAKGEIIKTAKIGGRKTYYTELQQLFN